MKFFLICALLPALAFARGVHMNESEFEHKFHQLPSNDPDFEAAEAEALEESEAEINRHNADLNAHFKEGLNPFSNMPFDLFEKEKEGLNMPEVRSMGLIMPENPEDLYNEESDKYIRELMMSRTSVPSSYDGVSAGYVTPVKNQKSCGSCAAFSSTAVVEACMIKAGAPANFDLAEQYIIDCGYNGKSMGGCNGAYPTAYIEWIAGHEGEMPHEFNDPYVNEAASYKCPSIGKYHTGAKLTKPITSYSTNENEMKTLVYEHGAAVAAIYASDKALQNYQSGVFDACSSTSINHAITVVGYGSENGMDFWKIKNSWGSNWGEDGFFKLRRGTGACGIGEVIATAQCEYKGNPDAPLTTTTTETPANLVCDLSSGMYAGYHPMNYENLSLNSQVNGKVYESVVNCKNSKCTPSDPSGVTNACMYICGRTSC